MTASPESLHLLAHRAQRGARTEADWWDNPLDTALAATSAARHPPAYRQDGEAAVRRLQRWNRSGGPRRVSADVAAISLAAAAAADLGLRDRELPEAAITAASELLPRTQAPVPMLHLGLIAWGLAGFSPNRDSEPWLALRARLSGLSPGRGVDGAIGALAIALTNDSFPAADLVRNLITSSPSSPSLEDGSVLLWVFTVAIERSASSLGENDAGFLALTDRRADLAQRLAQELDADSFEPPEVPDFDPEAQADFQVPVFLSPTEALLLDISLASQEQEPAWLRFEEAASIFGSRERRAVRHLALRSTGLLSILAVASGGLVGVIAHSEGASDAVAVLSGFLVAAIVLSGASITWYRFSRSPVARSCVAFLLTLTLCSALDLANSALAKPLFTDAAGLIASLLIAAAVVVIVAATSSRKIRD